MLQGENVSPHHSRQSAGSSDRSPQSSSVSHFHQNGIHLSFLQTNWWEMLQEHISNEKWYVSFCFRPGLSLRSWSGSSIMRSPGWQCSWTCTVSHQRPGKSLWDRHIYNLRRERADTSYCNLHCRSDTGDLWLQWEWRDTRLNLQLNSRDKTRWKVSLTVVWLDESVWCV